MPPVVVRCRAKASDRHRGLSLQTVPEVVIPVYAGMTGKTRLEFPYFPYFHSQALCLRSTTSVGGGSVLRLKT